MDGIGESLGGPPWCYGAISKVMGIMILLSPPKTRAHLPRTARGRYRAVTHLFTVHRLSQPLAQVLGHRENAARTAIADGRLSSQHRTGHTGLPKPLEYNNQHTLNLTEAIQSHTTTSVMYRSKIPPRKAGERQFPRSGPHGSNGHERGAAFDSSRRSASLVIARMLS